MKLSKAVYEYRVQVDELLWSYELGKTDSELGYVNNRCNKLWAQMSEKERDIEDNLKLIEYGFCSQRFGFITD